MKAWNEIVREMACRRGGDWTAFSAVGDKHEQGQSGEGSHREAQQGWSPECAVGNGGRRDCRAGSERAWEGALQAERKH